MLISMKQTLIWFNLQRYGTGNGLPNTEDSFAESLQLRTSVLHQSMCIFKPGLSSSYDGCAKYKQKVSDQNSIKMLKQHAIPISSLANLKIYSPKGCGKTSQR